MKNHLELINLDKLYPKKEKITLPRYPIPQVTFRPKAAVGMPAHSLEIRDITPSGMQVENKMMHTPWNIGEVIEGELRFLDHKIPIRADIIWIKQGRAGLKFQSKELQKKIQDTILNISHLIQHLKPLHQNLSLEKPLNLRYWFQSAGPLEFMVWGDKSDPLASSLWVYSHFFVQWNDAEGLKTGKIYRQRADDEWNLLEGECVLLFDQEINQDILAKLAFFIKNIAAEGFEGDDYSILKSKLS